MLKDLDAGKLKAVYIVCGLSLGFFYPHLLGATPSNLRFADKM